MNYKYEATEILEEYASSYSEVDVERLARKLESIGGDSQEIESIPVAVLHRKVDGIDAADACDQAGRWDYIMKNAIKTILDWYETPDYKLTVEHTNLKRGTKR